MSSDEPVTLTRDVEAAVIPVGNRVTLEKGGQAYITQTLGGSYTVIVNGNMFRIEGKDADALGLEVAAKPVSTGAPVTQEQLEKEIWNQLRSCYDPEIPVNIVDLGLVYECALSPRDEGGQRATVRFTLTAPGCGMGDFLRQDVIGKLMSVPGIDQVDAEVVFDPQWNQSMMSDAARLQLGMM